jgi:hypothetical protein
MLFQVQLAWQGLKTVLVKVLRLLGRAPAGATTPGRKLIENTGTEIKMFGTF